MDRRWRLEASQHLATLPSLGTVLDSLPDLQDSAGLATPSDVYAVLCALHARGSSGSLKSSSGGRFHYFLHSTGYTQVEDKAGTDTAMHDSGQESLEAVVPVSTAYGGLSVSVLHGLFPEVSPACSHLVIALVASDGAVTMQRLFNHVQPPEEGHNRVALSNEDEEATQQQQQQQLSD